MMTRCEDVQARLGDLIDGGVPPSDEAQLRSHVGTCAACRALTTDLERLRSAARSLGPITPSDHVWLQIAGRLRREARTADAGATHVEARRATRQWLGIAAALVLVTIGLYAVGRLAAPASPGNVTAGSTVESVDEELRLALDHYENAIAHLKSLAGESDSLDPAVAAMLDQNMAIIDTALTESKAALLDDPSNQPARASLFEALSQKVNVLQATAVLINEMRQGNAEGAAEAAAGIGGKSSS
jgi:hypothetical protein